MRRDAHLVFGKIWIVFCCGARLGPYTRAQHDFAQGPEKERVQERLGALSACAVITFVYLVETGVVS
jgi:hypothetical protein